MGSGVLIDSNAVLDFLGGELPATGHAWFQQIVRGSYMLSVVSRIELLGHRSVEDSQTPIAAFVGASRILPLDEPVILETIRLRTIYRRKLPDAIIAATALVYNLTLVTRNVADFRTIAGLTVVNPHDAPTLLPR